MPIAHCQLPNNLLIITRNIMFSQNLAELFAKAGLTRWALLICSIVGLAIILERLTYFIRTRYPYEKFRRELFVVLAKEQLMPAIHLCNNINNPTARLAGVYISNLKNRKRESVLSREGSQAIEKVEARMRGLATIVHIAPLLGLLGTVAGLVSAFQSIEDAIGPVSAQALAGGIWEALLSTVFGLIIAIPCMVAYHTFEGRADKIARRMQLIVSELDEFFGNQTKEMQSVSESTIDDNLTQ
ncbi:MAG: biopolymer transport protein ExbB [Candidatus Omnitrophota bacterium]